MSSSAKRSSVWKYFVEVDKNKSKCNLCGVHLSRGGVGKTATTSSMKKHLQTKHKSEYDKIFGTTSIASSSKEFVSQSSESQESGVLKQLSLEDMLEKKKLWDINDSRAKRYHYLIGEMIAVDNEPFSLVESHVGFRRFVNNILPQYEIPSRKYFSENVIPDIYNKVVNNIKSRLAPVNHISFTTDMWTCQTNKTCFLSCTAHWLEESYMLGHAVLDMKVFPESHTAENITKSLLDSVSDWNIPATKVRAVVHDNAANITKAVKDANIPSFRCFIHTLQLVINDAIDANTSVKETISAARRIVTHFNHSGYNKLHEIQEELGLPKNKLHQDVSTRWNSTYYLLERINEQRRAISVYFAESRNLNFENLSSDQWEIVLQLIILLKPFEEVTKITSSTYSPISDVIPHAVTLMRYLRKEELSEKTYQVDDFRNALVNNMNKVTRFNLEYLFENRTYFLSTFLDPRYKINFYNAFQADQARKAVLREALKISLDTEGDELDNDAEPAEKRARMIDRDHTASEAHNLFWECFEEAADASTSYQPNDPKNSAAAELDHYLSVPRAARDANPYKWWVSNKGHYPILGKVAAQFLSTPASSVYSERLFSEAGLIYEAKRSKLDPNRAEKLVFLHHNLPLLNFKY